MNTWQRNCRNIAGCCDLGFNGGALKCLVTQTFQTPGELLRRGFLFLPKPEHCRAAPLSSMALARHCLCLRIAGFSGRSGQPGFLLLGVAGGIVRCIFPGACRLFHDATQGIDQMRNQLVEFAAHQAEV
jgi:hypothetical protein